MGAKRKSGGSETKAAPAKKEKKDVQAISAGDIKKEAHLKLLDEWMTFGS